MKRPSIFSRASAYSLPLALALSLATPSTALLPLTLEDELGGEDVSEALEQIRAKTGVPGLVALAMQDGEVVAWAAAGVRAEGSGELMTIDDPVHLGSCSKAMTSTLVARLIEEGVLTWDTTIAQAMPEFAKTIDAGFREVSVENLLRHRGGIAERRRPEIAALHEDLQAMQGTPVEIRRRILAMVLAHPPLAPPEGGFDYSNFGYMTAGAMLEELTGKSWAELLVEKVFRPLGMQSAGIGSPTGDHAPVGHVREDEHWKPLPPGPAGVLPEAMGPAGLTHCNLADWASFVHEHVAGERGENGLVAAESYRRMHRRQASEYVAGWVLTQHTWSWGQGQVLAHNGSDSTWHSLAFAMPEWDLTVLSATNAGGAGADQATGQARDLLLRTLGFED